MRFRRSGLGVRHRDGDWARGLGSQKRRWPVDLTRERREHSSALSHAWAAERAQAFLLVPCATHHREHVAHGRQQAWGRRRLHAARRVSRAAVHEGVRGNCEPVVLVARVVVARHCVRVVAASAAADPCDLHAVALQRTSRRRRCRCPRHSSWRPRPPRRSSAYKMVIHA